MKIRKANQNDYIHIVRSIQNKKISYITAAHIKEDINNGRQYVMTDDNEKVIAILSIIYDNDYHYYAMKRLCVPNKKNRGKGYAKEMIQFVSNSVNDKVGCTPWIENAAVRHTLEKLGFHLEYIFSEKWCFYSKEQAPRVRCLTSKTFSCFSLNGML